MSAPTNSNDLGLYKCLPIPKGDYKDIYELQSLRMTQLHNSEPLLLSLSLLCFLNGLSASGVLSDHPRVQLHFVLQR